MSKVTLDIQLFLIAVFQNKDGSYRAYLMDDSDTFFEADSSYNAIRGLVSQMEAEDYHDSHLYADYAAVPPNED